MSNRKPRNTPGSATPRGLRSRLTLLYAVALLLVVIVGVALSARALSITVVILAVAALLLMQSSDFAEVQQRLMSNISHELRTPLNVALGYSEMLKDGTLGEMTDQQIDAASECHEAGQRILRILTDILDIGRARSYAMPLDPQQLDLREFVERTNLLLAGQARAAQVSLDAQVPDDLPAISADERRLKQLLYHLVLSSIIPSAANETVHLSSTRAGDRVRVTVTDNGPHMSGPDITAVFAQAPDTIADEGALAPRAVGLPLCAALARELDGCLSITSGPDSTTFACELPLAETLG